ncbi:thiamine pyrophosphokinase-related protein-like protein [Calycina marina]|uniref:Thiamine pyrophosphokinase-related protein-like protein n=1 Tax=Calycina marina TaxID=1763456 RepID=A0A9P7Z5Y5_9HELO|nr:thiamine pyrophosphokinase-related protein-like protein [Calycina marina]
MTKSNLDLVNECDSFPYPSSLEYNTLISTLYTLLWTSPDSTETPIGYLPSPILTHLARVPTALKGELSVSRARRTISCFEQPTEKERSAAVAAVCAHWRAHKTFAVLSGWRNELYPVYGPANALLFSIERSASPLFGVITYGVHLTAYTVAPGCSFGMKIWVPRRARTKQTYPGLLDNTVAGGMATGEEPLACVVREAAEEASLPEEVVRAGVQAKGTVTYCLLRDERAGGETGLVQPECEFVFDLELPGDVVPRPSDGEVEEFYLWTVEEVQSAMAAGEFKPNCSLVVLDFFIRHSILTKENEPDYEDIKKRIHRELEFPGLHRV